MLSMISVVAILFVNQKNGSTNLRFYMQSVKYPLVCKHPDVNLLISFQSDFYHIAA